MFIPEAWYLVPKVCGFSLCVRCLGSSSLGCPVFEKKLGALVLFIRVWGTLEFGTIIACCLRWNSNLTGMYVYFIMSTPNPGGLNPALLFGKNSEGCFKAPDLHEYMIVICAPEPQSSRKKKCRKYRNRYYPRLVYCQRFRGFLRPFCSF